MLLSEMKTLNEIYPIATIENIHDKLMVSLSLKTPVNEILSCIFDAIMKSNIVDEYLTRKLKYDGVYLSKSDIALKICDEMGNYLQSL